MWQADVIHILQSLYSSTSTYIMYEGKIFIFIYIIKIEYFLFKDHSSVTTSMLVTRFLDINSW